MKKAKYSDKFCDDCPIKPYISVSHTSGNIDDFITFLKKVGEQIPIAHRLLVSS